MQCVVLILLCLIGIVCWGRQCSGVYCKTRDVDERVKKKSQGSSIED